MAKDWHFLRPSMRTQNEFTWNFNGGTGAYLHIYTQKCVSTNIDAHTGYKKALNFASKHIFK